VYHASADTLGARFAAMRFEAPFRRYQELALDAFERASAASDRRIYLTMPPGSGKTVLGLEIARRIGTRAVVLGPNTAIQGQWIAQWSRFAPDLVRASTDTSLADEVTSLTYQSICVLERADDDTLVLDDDPGGPEPAHGPSIRDAAARLALERRRDRRRAMLDDDRAAVLELLHDNGREIVRRLGELGPITLILDECHHLLELWGHVLEAVIDEVHADSMVIGLTATPPRDLSPRQSALYLALFGGRADFEVVTPAVVKDGYLAPYQELALITRPTEREVRYIAAEQERFDELRLDLLDPTFATIPFGAWFARRFMKPTTRDGVPVGWMTIEGDHPDLARAAIRWRLAQGLDPPPGAHAREEHRQPPGAADWIALIEAYVEDALRSSDDPFDVTAVERIRRSLPAIGYVLTTTGIRAARTVVDRVLALSASKAEAAVRILEAEAGALGADLRALVLCDFERASGVGARLRGVLDPGAGGTALVLRTLIEDPRTADLSPMMVTGRHLMTTRSTATDLLAFAAQDPAYADIVRGYQPSASHGDRALSDPTWEDLVIVAPDDPRWRPRAWVPLATKYLEAGGTRCIVGTRGLLGEGWDSGPVNVLIDLGAATTGTSVHQVRGRSLRLDPDRPGKVADNWDVACVTEEHVRGTADYERFVRKHDRYFALASTGEIESGVSHVDPSLTPYGPPPPVFLEALAERMLARTTARDEVRAAWRIGEPYRDIPVDTVRVHFERSPGIPDRRTLRALPAERPLRPWLVLPASLGLAGVAGGIEVSSPWVVAAGVAGLAAPGGLLARDAVRAMQRLTPSDVLSDMACALADALVSAELVDPRNGSAAVRVVPQPDGYYRCLLDGADATEAKIFAVALDELISPLWDPRWIIARRVLEPPLGVVGAAGEYIRRWFPPEAASVVWHELPRVLARRRERVAAFEVAWRRWVYKDAEAIPVDDVRAQQVLALRTGDDPFDVRTQLRTLWT
jgi:superfamily II DNA or RNA helicase